jgi:hypothetical protein
MKRKQADPDKVIAIRADGSELRQRELELAAEACCKDFPSAESRAYVDGKLDTDPVWTNRHGNLMIDALDRALSGHHLGYASIEPAKRRAEQLKQEMGYADASAVERLLIEHIALCHARLAVVERLHALQTQGTHDRDSGLYWERRLTGAQNRFDRAVTTFARTRALIARADAARAEAERAQAANGLHLAKQRAA